MNTQPEPAPTEDLAQLIRRVMAEQDLTMTEISDRSGLTVSTISSWATRKRGAGGRGPGRDKLRALAKGLRVPEADVFAAAGRRVPGPISPDQEQQLLAYFRELTAEQQGDKLYEIEKLAERNRSVG